MTTLTILPKPGSGLHALEVEVVWSKGGLAVYETPKLKRPARTLWSVGHAGSGMAIVRAARSREQAIRLAEQFLQLTDWGRSAAALRGTAGLAERVKAIKYGAEGSE